MKRFSALAMAISIVGHVSILAQVTATGNNPPLGSYVGHMGANTNPVQVRHNGNYPIQWFTDSLRRMLLTPTITTGSINGYNSLNLSGHLGVGNFTNVNVPNPFTLLHLDNSGTQNAGFRSWMKAGMYITDESDQMYVGTYRRNPSESDRRDAVINWSDNLEANSQYGPDVLRFIFTRDNDDSNAASAWRGLELMRMVPDTNGNEGYVGIGDWEFWSLWTGQQPDERLHLLDRTIRLNRLIPDYNNDTLSRVVMVDSTGRLHWRRISTWPSSGGGGGTGCEWTLLGAPGSNSNIATAYQSNPGCPQEDKFVGIGTPSPWGKLHVTWKSPAGLQNGYAGIFYINGEADGKNAGDFEVEGVGKVHKGVRAHATGAQSELWSEGNIGVSSAAVASEEGFTYSNRALQADAQVRSGVVVKDNFILDGQTSVLSGSTVTNNYGVRSQLWNYGNVEWNYAGHFWSWAPQDLLVNSFGVKTIAEGGAFNYGLWAQAPVATNSWAAYVAGQGLIANGPWQPSDQQLKTNIEPVEAGSVMEALAGLSVHRYQYDTEQFPHMGLPQGEQVGLLAQELEQVLPGLVTPVRHPQEIDSLGNVVHEAVDYKAVNYTALIPYLVAGYQAQRSANDALAAQLAEQQARMDYLEEALAACCAHPGGADGRMQVGMGELIEGDARSLSIQPNPFNEQTTLSYTLERSGRAQLLVNSADGKQLKALYEAAQEAGQYQYTWNTGDLVPGVYYVTLLLDGEPLVKKAVKVSR
jgi:hypothetical protein